MCLNGSLHLWEPSFINGTFNRSLHLWEPSFINGILIYSKWEPSFVNGSLHLTAVFPSTNVQECISEQTGNMNMLSIQHCMSFMSWGKHFVSVY